MNEDDTFKALCRTPFEKLQNLMADEEIADGPIYESFTEQEINFLTRHGWTVKEFIKSWIEKSLKDRPDVVHYLWWQELVKSVE